MWSGSIPSEQTEIEGSSRVLPWTAKGGTNWLCTHRFDELDHRGAEDRVAVEDEISRCGVIGKRLSQLLKSQDEIANLCLDSRAPWIPSARDLAQHRRNRSRFQRATVSGFTITNRLAHAGQDWRSATQNARSVSSRRGRGRSFSSAATCCRRARFSITRSARRRKIARIARAPREMMKIRTRSVAVEFAAPSRRSQA